MIRPYREHVALVFGVTGQALEFYPPTDEIMQDGPPASAATVTVYKGDGSNDDPASIAFTGTATLDSVSTTTDAAAGPSQSVRDKVPLTATTNVVAGRRYLLTNTAAAGGQRQIIIPKAIASADYVTHSGDVGYDFASGSTFLGLRHSLTVDSTFIATTSNINFFGNPTPSMGTVGQGAPAPPYRAVWAYPTGGGLSRRYTTTFDVARAPLKHNVDAARIRRLLPDSVHDEWLAQRGGDLAPQIAEAFDRLRFDVRMAGYDPDAITDPEITNRLTAMATCALLATHGVGRPGDRAAEAWAEEWERRYQNEFQKAIGTVMRAWTQADSTGALASTPPQQLWLER